MWTGALPNGSKGIKFLMPIRGELSILAAIMTLGHNAAYGRTYFRLLITNPSRLPMSQLLAAVCSLLMLCMMLPLFVTSFKAVRKRMKPAAWKKLQRLAYGFYALLYLHVMLLFVPSALAGKSGYLLSVLVYSAVFWGYAVCRVLKAHALRARQSDGLPRRQMYAAAGALVLSLCLTGAMLAASQTSALAEDVPEAQESQAPEPSSIPESAAVSETPSAEPEPQETDADEAVNTESEAVEPSQAADSAPTETAAEPTSTEATAPAASASPAATATPAPTTAPATATPTATATPAPTPTPTPEPVRTYKNGTFTGSGQGYNGPITVSVTIQDDVITAISVTSSSDDEPFWSDGKAVIGRILSAQSTNVDAVSGATCSSDGILDAVDAALKNAKN
jgi:DMSO/TMAO reductase YedYZ heme-binding membrane subunit/uncharacterized protein with FMN-binding domain